MFKPPWDLRPTQAPPTWRIVLMLSLRVLLATTLLFTAYFLIPTKASETGSDVPWLVLSLCTYGLVVAAMVPAISRSWYPILRGIEALALVVPLYLLIFARIYLSNSLGDPASFTQPLDKPAALYFTVTVFATVGFGDIVAQTSATKLMVTAQMLGNLVVLGGVVKLLTSATRRGIARRDSDGANADGADADGAGTAQPEG